MATSKQTVYHKTHKPDKLVESGERFIRFFRTHVVLITLAVMVVIVGIFLVAIFFNNQEKTRAAMYKELLGFDRDRLYSALGFENMAIKTPEEDAARVEEYVAEFQEFTEENIDKDIAPYALFRLAENSTLLAEEFYNIFAAQTAAWAYNEILNNPACSGSPIADAVDPQTKRNLIEIRHEEANELLARLRTVNGLFDEEGLWYEPEPEPETGGEGASSDEGEDGNHETTPDGAQEDAPSPDNDTDTESSP